MQYQLHHPNDAEREYQHEAEPEKDEVAQLALVEVSLPGLVALHTQRAEQDGTEHVTKAQAWSGWGVVLLLAIVFIVVVVHYCLYFVRIGYQPNACASIVWQK